MDTVRGSNFDVAGGENSALAAQECKMVNGNRIKTVWQTILAVAAALTVAARARAQTNLVTPAQYLESLPKPHFATGTRLPPLTRWGWHLSTNADVELANNWGYCLELGNAATPDEVTNIFNPGSFDYTMVQLVKSNPSKYKLSVLMDRTFTNPPTAFYCTNSSGQTLTDGLGHDAVCPEGPDAYWKAMAEYWVKSLIAIQSNAPISVILNGGEYGLTVPGFGKTAWLQDPRVQAATNGLTLYRYTSNRKAYQLGFLTSAIEQSLPARELYIFYNTGAEENRTTYAGGTQYLEWSWNSDVMVTNSDLPSFEDYYTGLGSWTNNLLKSTSSANPGYADLLTKVLDAVGYNIALGHPLNYSWLNGGSSANSSVTNTPQLSDITRYYGFLKCLYTSGMVGGVAGYFDYPTGGFSGSFAADGAPHWLLQMIALARVHALFSHFQNFLYDGDLISGPQTHSMSHDQPAYEFTNTVADATARVLARKLRNSNQWLVTAWAADGPDRTVTVNIPALGNVQVLARDSGAVYQATTTNLTLVDKAGLLPTQFSSPPGNLRLSAGGQ